MCPKLFIRAVLLSMDSGLAFSSRVINLFIVLCFLMFFLRRVWIMRYFFLIFAMSSLFSFLGDFLEAYVWSSLGAFGAGTSDKVFVATV